MLSAHDTAAKRSRKGRGRKEPVEVDPGLIEKVLETEIEDMESIVKGGIQPNGELSPEAEKRLKEFLKHHPEMVEDDDDDDDENGIRARSLYGNCKPGYKHRCIFNAYCWCHILTTCPRNTWFWPGGKHWHCTCPAGTKKVYSWFNARGDCL